MEKFSITLTSTDLNGEQLRSVITGILDREANDLRSSIKDNFDPAQKEDLQKLLSEVESIRIKQD